MHAQHPFQLKRLFLYLLILSVAGASWSLDDELGSPERKFPRLYLPMGKVRLNFA